MKTYHSVGPDGKKKSGKLDQLIQHYRKLARDEPDKIRAEAFKQHEEHYSRLKRK